MISETSAVEGVGSGKPAFIKQLRDWVRAHPAVGALVWFDTNDDSSSDNKDWRVDSSAASLAAFRGLASDSHFSQ